MAQHNAETMAALEARVVGRIEALLASNAALRKENATLREQRATLVAERATLVEKSEQARSRVEAMIARLRTMELGV